MIAPELMSGLEIDTIEQVENWIAAALAEYRALKPSAEKLLFATDDPAVVQSAKNVHAVWLDWATSAEALWDRLKPLRLANPNIRGMDDFRHAMLDGKLNALKTPEAMLHALRQIRSRETIPHEEVRREFRDRMDRRRATGV